jgi:Flp pilus assembly pilin Flp
MTMLHIIYHTLRKLGVDEKGASAVEYAILVGCIGAVLAVGARAFATDLSAVFTTLIGQIDFGAAA